MKYRQMTTGNYFAPGYRIRIEISSSIFPMFDGNLKTGRYNYSYETNPIVAHVNAHHSKQYPAQKNDLGHQKNK